MVQHLTRKASYTFHTKTFARKASYTFHMKKNSYVSNLDFLTCFFSSAKEPVFLGGCLWYAANPLNPPLAQISGSLPYSVHHKNIFGAHTSEISLYIWNILKNIWIKYSLHHKNICQWNMVIYLEHIEIYLDYTQCITIFSRAVTIKI